MTYSVQLVATAGKTPRDQDIVSAEFYVDGKVVGTVPCKAGEAATYTAQVAEGQVTFAACFVDAAGNRGPLASQSLDLLAPGAPAGFRIASVTFVP
jgi:hypothetical protein